MTQKTMTEKDMFLQEFARECDITLRVLRAYPADKASLKPSEKSRSAAELAFVFVAEQTIAGMALSGKIELGRQRPPAPSSFTEIITMFEAARHETVQKVTNASDEQLSRIVQFPIGPGKMGDFRAQDILWLTVKDMVHHRGQLSVYLRIAGGKLPSIYGPTADETWM